MEVRVKTVKPERISDDWSPGAYKTRVWDVKGTIFEKSDSHGVIYRVRHDDGTIAWYEPRELVLV